MKNIPAKIINSERLVAALGSAFQKWAKEDIDDAHWDDQFRDMGRWRWFGETRRRNGETVGSPRDIYDLGTLYESKEYSFSKSSVKAEANWHWGAVNSSGQEYAYYVHYGTRLTRARPFTDDIAIASSFLRKTPGMALLRQMQTALDSLYAN
jgi:hypothetical protein